MVLMLFFVLLFPRALETDFLQANLAFFGLLLLLDPILK